MPAYQNGMYLYIDDEDRRRLAKQYSIAGSLAVAAKFLFSLDEGLKRTKSESNFNMKCWECVESKTPFNPESPGTCGFAGCAIGWIAQAAIFAPQGFSLKDGYPFYKPNDELAFDEWDAIKIFFNIPSSIAINLFSPDQVPFITPSMVAERIEEYLKTQ